MTEAAHSLIARWRNADDRARLLQVIQPGLVGLIDGTVSTLAPIFASAYIAARAPLCSSVSRRRWARRSAWASPRLCPTTASSPAAARR